MNNQIKRRSESYFGLHFDFHAEPENCITAVGATLKEEDIREICRLIQPDFIQIDCKGHPGWASYPSKCGNGMPKFDGDPLALWRKVTREEGVALYMHYSGVIDRRYAKLHPEDCVVNADGTVSDSVTRVTSKYVDDLMIPQLAELAGDYQVDGVWVDGECWGTMADFHPSIVAAFEEKTGIDLQGKLPAEPEDAYYEEYRDFCRELFRAYVRYYVDKLHEKYPDFQIASNWAYTDHMPEEISANVDFISGDLDPWDSFRSARYAGRAIAQQNFTWDLMSWNFRNSHGGQVPKHPNQIIQEAAAVISLGAGYQNYITQRPDGSPRMEQVRFMKQLEEFVRPRQDYCFRGKLRHQVALLMSTYDRHHESASLYLRNGNQKISGLTSLICDAGHSLEIVSEHTLKGNYDQYPVIVVPELFCGLAEETMQELLQYARNGGKLLLVGKNTCKLFAKAGAPFAIADESDAIRMFTLDQASFGGAFGACDFEAENAETLAWIGAVPHSVEVGYVATMSHLGASSYYQSVDRMFAAAIPFEKGQIAMIGTDLGTAYFTEAQYLHRDLINCVLGALYTPDVRLESADGIVEIVDLEKNGQLMVQLINANGTHLSANVSTNNHIPASYDVQLSIACKAKPKALLLQPEAKELAFDWRDGRAYVTVDKLAIHEIIQVVEA